MKLFLPTLFTLAGAFALFSLTSASSAPGPSSALSGISEGTTMRSLNMMKGTAGGFTGLRSDTPVTVLKVEGDWILVDYPAQVGGPTWLNQNAIISYQERL